jgi:hypothetical protein
MGIKMKLAYIDEALNAAEDEDAWLSYKGYNTYKGSPKHEDALKTVAHLEDIFEVDTFSEFNEESAKQIIKNHKENKYTFLITDLVMDKSKKRFSYNRGTSHMVWYEDSIRLLDKTAKELEDVKIILYLREAWDVIRCVFHYHGFEGVVQNFSDFYLDYWKDNMNRLDKKMLEQEPGFKFDFESYGKFLGAIETLEK